MPDLFLELQNDDPERGITPAPPLSEGDALALLHASEIVSTKLIPWGSNYSFAVALDTPDGRDQLAIYKPRAGEAPLYDFPDGTLYLREVAAYELSRLLGWDFVPPTVIHDGPHGVGSLQLYVQPTDERVTSESFWRGCTLDIERMVLFDHVTNNADRKIGHCLRDADGKVWGIDHGLTFNQYPKLRTVLWQFVGEPVSPDLVRDLERLRNQEADIRAQLAIYLSRAELNALFARIGRILANRRYPLLNTRRNIPYGWW